MYGAIRRCENIVLVAGSGMGDAEGSFPYLTGEWSSKHHLPMMPFDGILLGSRVMVAKEARTSPAVKRAIVAAQGVDDSQWSKTYNGVAGGVITVVSEMGEPIHKLATDGVLLWAELDKTVFSISDKSKRAQVLKAKRNYIINRLNTDSHKVWFGWSKTKSKAVGLEEMTYSEVVSRLVALTYIHHRQQWIDDSFRTLAHDFIHHAASRFVSQAFQTSTLPSYADLEDPESCMERLFATFPSMDEDLMSYQDVKCFLAMCKRKGQKPVPFVPALDENFETWFKKDSLWQSEDLDAVVDQDVRRVCILQGPVAVRHSTKVDEPIKDILTNIHQSYIRKLLDGQKDIPFVECFGLLEECYVERQVADSIGNFCDWQQAFFSSKTLVQGSSVVENPMRRILKDGRTVLSDVGPNRVHLSIVQDESVQAIRVELFADNVIELRILGNITAENGSADLSLKFRYVPESGFAPIHEIMDGRNERIRDFYRQVWLGQRWANTRSIRDEYIQGPSKITSKLLKQFMHALECPEVRSGDNLQAPMDYAMVAAWRPLVEPLLANDLTGNLLDLVHVSNSFKVKPGVQPLAEGDVVETRSRVTAVVIQASGKMVEVEAHIFRGNQLVMEIRSQFLIRGNYVDQECCFQVTEEAPVELQIKSTSQLQVFLAKSWLQFDKSFIDMLRVGAKLIFRLRTHHSSDEITVSGDVEARISLRKGVQVATVRYAGAISKGNPVSNYLKRHGQLEQSPVMFANPVPLEEFTLEVPISNKAYAVASGDLNPIHLSPALSQYLGLPGTITHGMHTSARVRLLIERHVCSLDRSSFKSFHCSFVGMVLPGQKLKIISEHVGMKGGHKIIKMKAVKSDSEEAVLIGEAEIENGKTAFVFTGQGSQRVGMGMDLYATSEAAREVWDRADQHFLDNYGFLITDIVKNNPKEHIIRFGGRSGRGIRQNYMDLVFLDIAADGTTSKRPVFPQINEFSTSLTFSSPEGLLSATQFTQPALTLMEIAAFRDMQSRGVVSAESYFAGHSLGEYSALCAVVDVAAIEELMSVVFYRGLTMQYAVKRDESGRSDFAMVAVNPSRVPNFDGATLNVFVKEIATATSSMIEVVNYNVEGQQYICAGELRALKCLGDILDRAHSERSIHLRALTQQQDSQPLRQIIDTALSRQSSLSPLQRGKATIPLPGIDVPFHSSYLRAGVAPFRHHLSRFIRRKAVDVEKLRGRYVPNLTARPFEVSQSYLQDVLKLTGSGVVEGILDRWDELETWVPGTSELQKPMILVEATCA
ncbi:fatty acid synthase beta subunit dehydratase [Phaeosphaeriaceae sp. PMI808]|nr:fatty acid synthase beta subunit dehydratase [Phaeosphaeriaceae sp. PMI808]